MSGKSEQNSIPQHWSWVRIGDISTFARGVYFKKTLARTNPAKDHTPVLRTGNIGDSITTKAPLYVPSHLIKPSHYLKKHDILISLASGNKRNIGKTAQAHEDLDCSFGLFCGLIRPSEDVNKLYLGYYVKSQQFRQQILKRAAGSSMYNLRNHHVKSVPVPLPPREEQDLIVEKIETLLNSLNPALEILSRTEKPIFKYRRSLLKHCLLGDSNVSFVNGQPKTTQPHVDEAPVPAPFSLPEHWKWVLFGSLIESMKNGIYKPRVVYSTQEGTPIVRAKDNADGFIDGSNLRRVGLTQKEIERFTLLPGDIIINGVNFSQKVGKAGSIQFKMKKAVHDKNTIRIRLRKNHADSKYVTFWLQFYLPQHVAPDARRKVGWAAITQSQLSKLPVPFPPLKEQSALGKEIEDRLSSANAVARSVFEAREKALQLRNSILYKAFSGELIPHNF